MRVFCSSESTICCEKSYARASHQHQRDLLRHTGQYSALPAGTTLSALGLALRRRFPRDRCPGGGASWFARGGAPRGTLRRLGTAATGSGRRLAPRGRGRAGRRFFRRPPRPRRGPFRRLSGATGGFRDGRLFLRERGRFLGGACGDLRRSRSPRHCGSLCRSRRPRRNGGLCLSSSLRCCGALSPLRKPSPTSHRLPATDRESPDSPGSTRPA